MRILIVEDHLPLAQGIAAVMRDAGYSTDHVADGLDAEDYVCRQGADIAIVDLNLPRRTGLDVIHTMRSRGHDTPVLILTARNATQDRLAGFEAGADDYLIKPFEMAELLARVRALARRRGHFLAVNESVGSLNFNRTSRRLTGQNGEVALPRREKALFEELLNSIESIVSKHRLVESLYGTGAEVEENAIELLVSRLRRKLAGTGVEIRTARGLGYMMVVGQGD